MTNIVGDVFQRFYKATKQIIRNLDVIFLDIEVLYTINAATLYESIRTCASVELVVCVAAFEFRTFSARRKNVAEIFRAFNVGEVMITTNDVELTLRICQIQADITTHFAFFRISGVEVEDERCAFGFF